jgi:hypothetical protein
MTNTIRLARCPTCDLLIPLEQQWGLNKVFYCFKEAHWIELGYNSVAILEGLDRANERALIQYRAVQLLHRRVQEANQILSQQSTIDTAADPELDAQVKPLLGWLDHPAAGDEQ